MNIDQVIELRRQPDGEGQHLHFTGGLRAAKIAEGAWRIEPVLVHDKPCATAPLTMAQMKLLANNNHFQAIAFHDFGWRGGIYHSIWTPIIPGETNHFQGPAELWSNIAGNLARRRTKKFFETTEHTTQAEIAKELDDQGPEEALARYISLSLRSMDISIEQIAEHYNEQLGNHIAAQRVEGQRSTNTLAQTLYAHVHSFFLHLGAARDYLGILVATRMGLNTRKADSMANFVKLLQQGDLPSDALLNLLVSSGNVAAHPQNAGMFAVAGWMQEATTIRNRFVHKRPYGSAFSERCGWASAPHKGSKFLRYFRSIELGGNETADVLDIIHHHYRKCTELFYKAAKVSGSDTAILHITDKDIISNDLLKPTEEDN